MELTDAQKNSIKKYHEIKNNLLYERDGRFTRDDSTRALRECQDLGVNPIHHPEFAPYSKAYNPNL